MTKHKHEAPRATVSPTTVPSLGLAELLQIDTRTLASKQAEALRTHIIGVLTAAADKIRRKDYDLKTFRSPAGDGYGSDNDCLDFAWEEGGEPLDIQQALGVLANYEAQAAAGAHQ